MKKIQFDNFCERFGYITSDVKIVPAGVGEYGPYDSYSYVWYLAFNAEQTDKIKIDIQHAERLQQVVENMNHLTPVCFTGTQSAKGKFIATDIAPYTLDDAN